MCAALLIHLPNLLCPLLYDDVPLIETHPLLGSPGFLVQLWQRDYGLEFARAPLGYYRPLFTLLVYLAHAVWGSAALGYHLVSLILFSLTTALVTSVASIASNRSRGVAQAAGLLYAVHPARLETVSFFMSLPDLLIEAAALLLISLQARLARDPAAASPGRAAGLALALGGLAAITKESAFFVFPALAATALACAMRHATPDRRHTAIGALALIAGLGLGMGVRSAAGIVAPVSLGSALAALLGSGAATAWETWWRAWSEALIPGPVVFWRLPAATPSPLSLPAITLALLVLAGLWIGLLQRARVPVALLTAWAGANAVNLLLMGASGFVYAQRYVALAPLVILGALAGARILSAMPALRISAAHARRARQLRWLLFALYLAAHAGYTLAGTASCWSRVGFATAMHRKNPHDLIPLGALAEALNQAAAPADRVEARVREATDLDPHHTQTPRLHNMLIKRYLADRDFDNALRVADWSLQHYPSDADKQALRAVALASMGRFPQAIEAIDAALLLQPGRTEFLQLRHEFSASPHALTP